MKESASGHQPVGVEARLRLTFLEPSMTNFAFALICQDIQQEDFGICPLWDPVFLSRETSGRCNGACGMCPFPIAPNRPFVPSSVDIPQARFRQIRLPTGHSPVFISERRPAGPFCFYTHPLLSWKLKSSKGGWAQRFRRKGAGWTARGRGLFCRPG